MGTGADKTTFRLRARSNAVRDDVRGSVRNALVAS